MPTPPISLVKLPRSLCKGVDPRLPRNRKFKDLTGTKFKLCRVVGFAGYEQHYAVWLCRCNCGKLLVARSSYLTSRDGRSCGCAFRNSDAARKVKSLWGSIKSRCDYRWNPAYPAYGGRGITMCKRWRASIEAFARDIGPRPSPKHMLVRRDKSGNYTPKNCFWGTAPDISRGSRRTKEITYNRKTQSMRRWARELGISRQAMQLRVIECEKRGLDLSLAITHPKGKRWP